MTVEIRSFAATEVRYVRPATAATADGATTEARAGQVVGYAAVYDADSEVMVRRDSHGRAYEFVEQVKSTAFERSINAVTAGALNVFGFWGHDHNQVIASTRSGTLSLESDAKGLRFTMDPARLNTMQLAALEAGDMRVSFGFSVPEGGDEVQQRADGMIQRNLTNVHLFEISPTSTPAYPDTSAGVRSVEAFIEARSMSEETVDEEASEIDEAAVETVEETVETVEAAEPKFNARAMQAQMMERGLKQRIR